MSRLAVAAELFDEQAHLICRRDLASERMNIGNLDPTLAPFHRIGGQPTVDRIIDSFYDRMDTMVEARVIRALHPEDLSATRAALKKYLAEWLGGPAAYTQERGHPRLRARHLPFSIGDEERDAWMFCMRGAMEHVVTDQAVREGILQKLSQVADWMRNRSPVPG